MAPDMGVNFRRMGPLPVACKVGPELGPCREDGCYGERVIYEAVSKGADWLTLVVRAGDEAEAAELAEKAAREYQGAKFEEVTLRVLDPDGAPGVLIEDAS